MVRAHPTVPLFNDLASTLFWNVELKPFDGMRRCKGFLLILKDELDLPLHHVFEAEMGKPTKFDQFRGRQVNKHFIFLWTRDLPASLEAAMPC